MSDQPIMNVTNLMRRAQHARAFIQVDADGNMTGIGIKKQMRVFQIPAYDSNDSSTIIQICEENDCRRSFRVINIGLNDAIYTYDTPVDSTHGWPLPAAMDLGGQGGGDDDTVPHNGEIYAVSEQGTTIVVIEG